MENIESLQTNIESDNNKPSHQAFKKKAKKKKAKKAKPFISAPMGAPLNDTSRANRPIRQPIGSQRRLSVQERPGFVRRWVNDIDDRVNEFKRAGYTVVEDKNLKIGDNASKDATSLGATRKRSVGRGRYAYLMEIPEEYYREDQAAKIKENMDNQNRIAKADPGKDQYDAGTVINATNKNQFIRKE